MMQNGRINMQYPEIVTMLFPLEQHVVQSEARQMKVLWTGSTKFHGTICSTQ